MSPLSEAACAEILAAAMGKSVLPTAGVGAEQLPKMGAQPPVQQGAATQMAKADASMPQMGPQPTARTGKEEMPRASGDSCVTPKAPQSAADDEGEQDDAEPRTPRAGRRFCAGRAEACEGGCRSSEENETDVKFAVEDTVFIFDWDDTVLPSSWVQSQGLRLDDSCEVSPEQWDRLQEVAAAAKETLLAAKKHGHVVLVTNAERGWIELSCAKFMPMLASVLEDVKLLSARTTYETIEISNPMEWKVMAFENEIRRIYAETAIEPHRRKNVLSLGDSLHEREALLRATSQLPNCRSKSLKFVERPDITQICKQHALVTSCFDRIVHHDGNLDLCIRCA